MYDEYFQIIAQMTEADFQPTLISVKDTLYSIYKKKFPEQSFNNAYKKELSAMLDTFFVTNRFSTLYAENSQKMDDKLNERTKFTDELLRFNIQYELSFHGKIIATNSALQNNGFLVWNVDMFRFLADDYTLTAEWRKANVWAFVIFFVLLFAAYCLGFRRKN
jgi:hypothetical protein